MFSQERSGLKRLGMLRAESAFADRQRALQELPGLLSSFLSGMELRETSEYFRDIEMIRSRELFEQG